MLLLHNNSKNIINRELDEMHSGWLIYLSHVTGLYGWFLNRDLPVIGKLKFSKMPLKHPSLYLCRTLTKDYSSILNNCSCAADISVVLASVVGQGE